MKFLNFREKTVLLEFIKQASVVLTFAGIVQGAYLALILNRQMKKSRANVFLSVLLMVMSFSIAHILYAGRVIAHISVDVYSLGDPTFLLIAPLLWFFVEELMGDQHKFSWKSWVHFLPFGLIILFSLTFNSLGSDSFIQLINDYHRVINMLFWILVVVQFSLYLNYIHRKTRKFQHLLQEEVSNIEGVDISWVWFFLVIFSGINLFFLFSLISIIHGEYWTWHKETTALIFSLSIFALGYKGIFQQEISRTGEKHPEQHRPHAVPDQNLLDRLLAHMREQKPYLDQDLTLTALAKDLDISRSELSHLINKGMGDNFYDFVNKYRVEEVKAFLSDPKMDHYSLLGLALEAGFKSKSTFNLIFKRFTGLTPTEYRKNIINQ